MVVTLKLTGWPLMLEWFSSPLHLTDLQINMASDDHTSVPRGDIWCFNMDRHFFPIHSILCNQIKCLWFKIESRSKCHNSLQNR